MFAPKVPVLIHHPTDDESLACTRWAVLLSGLDTLPYGLKGSRKNWRQRDICVRHTIPCYFDGRDEGISDQDVEGVPSISVLVARILVVREGSSFAELRSSEFW